MASTEQYNSKASMMSTEDYSSKIAPESQVSKDDRRRANYFPIDLSLRILLFAVSLTAIIVMVTSKQTELVQVLLVPFPVANTAKFNHTPAFVYFVAALSVASFYSIVSILASLASKQHHSNKLLFHLILVDLLMLGIVASATGSAGSIAYTGLKGNSHAGWGKVCHVYNNYCRHVGSSIALCLVASIILVVLVMLSTHALYRRSS